MKIELGEDNGFLNDGVPTMVVVTCTLDDGKKIKFPYDATKNIGCLYEDVRRFCNQAPVYSPVKEDIDDVQSRVPVQPLLPRVESRDKHFTVSDPNRIEREDIVRCVVLEKRESSCDVAVGGEYRVLKAYRRDLPSGPNGQMQTVYDGYDVINDNSPTPIRTYVFPHEIVLARKRVPPPQKISVLEELVNCGFCQEPNSLPLDEEKNKYIGECVKCNSPIEAERPSVKPVDKTS